MTAVVFLAMNLATVCRGEERFMRYRLVEPATPSVAKVSAHSNANSPEMPRSWGRNPMPGTLSNKGIYIQPGTWSPWQSLPSSPMWGDVGIQISGADPISKCKVEIQVASWPEAKFIARTFTIENANGSDVAFTLPPSILEDPDLIESLPETFLRRRKVADSVAVREALRPKLLKFSPFNIKGDSTVADSENYELETTRRLGFNTWHKKWLPDQYLGYATTGSTPESVKTLKYSSEEISRMAYLIVLDEPHWIHIFPAVWAKTGEQGFQDYLKAQGVTPEMLGVKNPDDIRHIRRDKPVAADAPLPIRRLWYWSCRYTFYACSQYFAEVNKEIQANMPNAPVTINYSDHQAGLIGGALGGSSVDWFEDGRLGAVSMHWSEDWMFGGLTSWGNGMYQKVSYFADLLRGSARYKGIGQSSVGFYPVCIGWDPKGASTARDIPVRINLLLSQGCKTFSYFNYGPTTSATVDYWADSAPIARGVADAARMVGGDKIEPYLWAGMPVDPQVCLIYSVEDFYWIEANKAQEDEFERQHFYCMLQQKQIPIDIIAGRDLEKFIKNYKVAYGTDRILVKKSAEDLKKWVELGGVLVLGPDTYTRDEYNEPLGVFSNEPGQARVGKGWVVRFKEREGALWWKKTVELCKNSKWPSTFDREHADIVCKPAFELANLTRPVTVNIPGAAADSGVLPGIVAEPLVSVKGVAVPLVNLRGLYEKGGTPCLKLEVTLTDGKGIVKAYSSRCGELAMRREGSSVSATLPLDYADVLIFAREQKADGK